MSKKSKQGRILLISLLLLTIAGLLSILILPKLKKPSTINGLLMLIEFEEIDGILHWERELDQRQLTAMVKVQDNMLEAYPTVFRRLADKGYEIAGGYDQAAFWDMSYEEQYQHLKVAQELVETVTGRPMRVFGSRYFAYDDNTLKAADELGIEYILARGTQDVNALIYAPEEYQVKIISVTNVDNGSMGRGSLCDYSLWARGSEPAEFAEILQDSLAKQPANMILVSHAYLGGTRQAWWEEYQKVLDGEQITWRNFSDWLAAQKPWELPNADIPINREVQYVEAQPAQPLEAYDLVPDLNQNQLLIFHNGAGVMCLEALAFFAEQQIDYEEHLNTDTDFNNLLSVYRQDYPASQGESTSYQYLPIIFYQGQAYSGFNQQVADDLLDAWQEQH